MRRFARLAGVAAVAFLSMAAVALATPGVSSADCDPNWSWNGATNMCKPPPPVPNWYTPRPPYAPSYSPALAIVVISAPDVG
jgi:hypothetical protein